MNMDYLENWFITIYSILIFLKSRKKSSILTDMIMDNFRSVNTLKPIKLRGINI